LPMGAEKAGLPPAHPPISDAKPLTFVAPYDWSKVTPTMPMRREQYDVPRATTDTKDGMAWITVMGPKEGGDVDFNVKRWSEQFAAATDTTPGPVVKRSTRALGSWNVIDIDIAGTYTYDESKMGGSHTYNEPNWRMLIAWVQAPSGNYYIRFVGPAATVAEREAEFRRFVDSAAH